MSCLENQPLWVKQQARSFCAWTNLHLKDFNMCLNYENITEEFKNGIALCQLFNALRGKKEELRAVAPLKPNMNPKMRIMQIENNSRAIQALKENFHLVITTSAEEITDGQLKLLLGLLWMIIARVAVDDISEEELTARDGLLAWCKRICGQYDVPIDDFNVSWQSGLGYLALAHAYDKSSFNWDEAVAEFNAAEDQAAAREKNLARAFDLIEEKMGIPKTFLDPAEMADLSVKPDDKSNVVYLSQIYRMFAGRQQYDHATNAVNRVISQLRQLEAVQHDYEERASAIVAFIEQNKERFATLSDYDTEGDARAAGKEAKGFLYETGCPEQQTALGEAVAVFQSIQSRRRNDGRGVYVPPEGLEPETVTAKLEDLLKACREFVQHTRQEIERHQKLSHVGRRFASIEQKARDFLDGQLKPHLERPIGVNASMIAIQERVIQNLSTDRTNIATQVAQLPELADQYKELRGKDAECKAEVAQELVSEIEKAQCLIEERQKVLREAREAEEARFARVSAGVAQMQNAFGQVADLLNLIETPLILDTLETAQASLEAVRGHQEKLASIEEEINAAIAVAEQLAQEEAELLADFTSISAPQISQTKERASSVAAQTIEQGQAAVDRLTEESEAAKAVIAQTEEIKEKVKPVAEQVEAALAITDTDKALAAWHAAQQALAGLDLESVIETLEREAARTEVESAITAVADLNAESNRLTSVIKETIDTLNRKKLDAASFEVPEETITEWQQVFTRFDKDKSGTLQRYELEAMLTATDQTIPAHKLDALYKGTSGLDFQGFVKVMMDIRKSGATAEGVCDAFATLANGSDYITDAQISQHFDEETASFLRDRLVRNEDGTYAYQSFSAAAFA